MLAGLARTTHRPTQTPSECLKGGRLVRGGRETRRDLDVLLLIYLIASLPPSRSQLPAAAATAWAVCSVLLLLLLCMMGTSNGKKRKKDPSYPLWLAGCWIT